MKRQFEDCDSVNVFTSELGNYANRMDQPRADRVAAAKKARQDRNERVEGKKQQRMIELEKLQQEQFIKQQKDLHEEKMDIEQEGPNSQTSTEDDIMDFTCGKQQTGFNKTGESQNGGDLQSRADMDRLNYNLSLLKIQDYDMSNYDEVNDMLAKLSICDEVDSKDYEPMMVCESNNFKDRKNVFVEKGVKSIAALKLRYQSMVDRCGRAYSHNVVGEKPVSRKRSLERQDDCVSHQESRSTFKRLRMMLKPEKKTSVGKKAPSSSGDSTCNKLVGKRLLAHPRPDRRILKARKQLCGNLIGFGSDGSDSSTRLSTHPKGFFSRTWKKFKF